MRHDPKLSAAALPAYSDAAPEAALGAAITRDFAGRIALVSSFGADSAALLHMVAAIDPATPVLFVETQMLFPETLAYQQDLAARLGLTDVRLLRPDPGDVAARDPRGDLHAGDPDACCDVRKVTPLERGLAGFDAWISGRKRAQSASRAGLATTELDGAGRVKINPLDAWSAQDVRAYMTAHDLPAHPLVARGFPSLGCAPCTTPVRPGEDLRAGRWRGRDKEECGIHIVDGRVVRTVVAAAAPMDRL
jgi:phosphoadenosine phosphosulfate reductase